MERESSRLLLRRAFQRLEAEVPGKIGRFLRGLRHPRSRWVRIPTGVAFMAAGVVGFLPVLGFWMLPLGLLLIAADVPFLQRPVARFTLWGLTRWERARLAWARRKAGRESGGKRGDG